MSTNDADSFGDNVLTASPYFHRDVMMVMISI